MAFGYIEPAYSVLEQIAHPAQDNPENTCRYELRQSASGRESPYIALWTESPSGEMLTDLLLLYSVADVALPDWKSLTGNEDVKLDDLHFIERIVNHDIGYGRDGGIAMY